MNYTITDHLAAEDAVDGITRGSAIKPQRKNPKQAPEDKPAAARKPAGKKGVVQRRAPSRGKYIDEYA